MAGRKRREPRDLRSVRGTVTPLRGLPPPDRAPAPVRSPVRPPPGTGVPSEVVAALGPKPPRDRRLGEPGAQRHLTHGTTDRMRGDPALQARAGEILARALEDPLMPDVIRSPGFTHAVRAWARAEAVAEHVWEWACQQIEDAGLGALMMPPMPGTNPVIVTVQAAESRAAYHRGRVGLDPVSYARIAKDLGIAGRAAEDDLRRMAGQGAAIVAGWGDGG